MLHPYRRAARQARVLEAERNRAQREAATARQVTDFLLDVFRAADPWGGRGERVTAQELLAAGSPSGCAPASPTSPRRGCE